MSNKLAVFGKRDGEEYLVMITESFHEAWTAKLAGQQKGYKVSVIPNEYLNIDDRGE